MSQLAPGQDIKYQAVRVKVIANSMGPQCWYAGLVGKVLDVDKKIYYQDGKPDGYNYEMKHTPGGGFNGHLMKEDVEETK